MINATMDKGASKIKYARRAFNRPSGDARRPQQ
jgi:hypothetical protein